MSCGEQKQRWGEGKERGTRVSGGFRGCCEGYPSVHRGEEEGEQRD